MRRELLCGTCGKLVNANKPLLGGLHLCLTECEQIGEHLDLVQRGRGPFWRRRTETFCYTCDSVVGEGTR